MVRQPEDDVPEQLTLSDQQVQGLASIARRDRATALRLQGQTRKKTTELRVDTWSHDFGWSEDGYGLRPNGTWTPSGTEQWREPDYEPEDVPPPPSRSAYHTTKRGT